tara:strand:- start:66 stop:329 length:264 start_codon:yes stop_codon:yes gene_type:complete
MILETKNITKTEWELLELLEFKTNGGWLHGKETNGLYHNDGVYEVNRGVVDNSLNLTKQDGYSVDIYDKENFEIIFKSIKQIIRGNK